MKAAVNLLTAREGGSATYARAMFEGFRRRTEHEFLFFLPPGTNLEAWRAPNVTPMTSPLCRTFGGRVLYEHFYMSEAARHWGADVLYCFADVMPFISTIPCVIANRNLEIYSPARWQRGFWRDLRIRLLRRLGLCSMRRAAGVVSMTQSAADDFERWMEFPLPRNAVVRHAIPDFQGASAKMAGRSESNGKPFFLTVAAIYPFKNLETLLRAFALFCGSTPSETELIIAGVHFDLKHFRFLQDLAAELRIGERVRFAGKVERAPLESYYESAEALILPSGLESFGYPVLEGMVMGTPMILSDIPVFRETAGEGALYVAPGDARALAAAMERISKDGALREKLAAMGSERAARYTVDDEADGLLSHFENCLKGVARHAD